MTAGAPQTIVRAGRRKAYRPLATAERRAAFAAGIAAYEAGDHFLAHELLEPAWMGTDDLVERDLHQGLIKLAAAFVHATRGNALGITKNLRGARERLAAAASDPGLEGRLIPLGVRLDVPEIIAAIDARLVDLRERPDDAAIDPVALTRGTSR